MKTLIKNGTVVNAYGSCRADVLCEGGFISALGNGLGGADEVIDASGCLVMPGFIDTHTHFDLDLGVTRTADDFNTGTRAAILGGTTTVMDFATQDRGGTLQKALDTWHAMAEGSSCNYAFHMAIASWNESVAAELPRMLEQGVSSYKMYMVYDALCMDDGSIYSVLKEAKKFGALMGMHCENWEVLKRRISELHSANIYGPEGHPISRPAAVEAEAVARYMRIAELAQSPVYIVHLSTGEGLIEARRARERGQTVYLETCPQYLFLTDDRYADADGAKFIMSPPLRKAEDNAALTAALINREIDFVGTDHCSFTMAQKALGGGDFSKTPNGGAGVQHRGQLIYNLVKSGRMSAERMVECLSGTAARLFGIKERGEIAPGKAADIVVWADRDGCITNTNTAHNCDNSPFNGIQTHGYAQYVILNGETAVRDGVIVNAGRGKYIKRSRCY